TLATSTHRRSPRCRRLPRRRPTGPGRTLHALSRCGRCGQAAGQARGERRRRDHAASSAAPAVRHAVHAQPARDDQHRPDRRKAEEARRRGGADARAPARRHVEAAARRAPAAGQDCGEQQHGPAVIPVPEAFFRAVKIVRA
ncbi:hypothetical protein Ctob_000606, partial [Chrysochromulina tobinii]